jgi:sarcosine oxidase
MASDRAYDCIVLGTGGVGSAALYHLARRGARALGLDRFPPGHDRGSSHGDTRIIRLAYFEHPDYVPLLKRAYELWAELEARSEKKLYHEVGLLQAGPVDGQVVAGVRDSAKRHGLSVEDLTPGEVEARWPGFRVPHSHDAVYEKRAGFLLVEECVRTHCEEAVRAGAEIRTGESVLRFEARGSGVTVITDRGSYQAGRLLITAGPWAPGLLAGTGLHLRVVRKPLLWYRTRSTVYRADAGGPCFLFETPAGIYYGFPEIDASGLKVAEHTGGKPVADPLQVDRSVGAEDRAPVERFLASYMPQVSSDLVKHAVCLYTLSPDENFVIDRHPAHPKVAFAAGLSGHGFKFTSVLGETLAQLALDGRAALPIEFLSLGRPALRAPPH